MNLQKTSVDMLVVNADFLSFTVDTDERIIRQCAINNHTELGCFERAGTYKIKMNYCECDTDGCNSASYTSVSIATVICFATGFMLFMVL